MTQHEAILQTISENLTTEEIEQVSACQVKLLAVMDQYPGTGSIALALIGAKLSEE